MASTTQLACICSKAFSRRDVDFVHSNAVSVSWDSSGGHVYLTPRYDAACNFVSSGALCAVSEMHLVG